ncbi:hypothetical protein J6590_090390 [Homalodisca vitripennis]|nr:hypothetical protein J6590_090390 [Homalodisca vitripennis]
MVASLVFRFFIDSLMQERKRIVWHIWELRKLLSLKRQRIKDLKELIFRNSILDVRTAESILLIHTSFRTMEKFLSEVVCTP